MKRHPIDTVSLVFALLFSAAVAWWGAATISHDPLHVPAAWIGAGTLLIVGLVGLISALRPQQQAANAPLTVTPEPPSALGPEHDPYSDPYFDLATLPRTDGVLDAEAIAAAYREAGFEDPETMASIRTSQATRTDVFPTEELPATPPSDTAVSTDVAEAGGPTLVEPATAPTAAVEPATDAEPTAGVEPTTVAEPTVVVGPEETVTAADADAKKGRDGGAES